MIEIVDPYINKFIRNYLVEDFIDLEGLVIAGGFASAMYNIHLLPSELKKQILNDPSENEKYLFYNDIDFWILKNSLAENLFYQAIQKHEQAYEIFSEPSLTPEQKTIIINQKFSEIAKIIEQKIGVKVKSSSLMAHTLILKKIQKVFDLTTDVRNFVLEYFPNKYQIIFKKIYLSIQDILTDFDINICQAAWKNDILYVTEECQAGFLTKEIKISRELEGLEYQVLVTITRIFKYMVRFPNFGISDCLLNNILTIYSELFKSLRENKDINNTTVFNNVAMMLPYNYKLNITKNDLMKNLCANIGHIVNCKNFKFDMAAFLLDSDINEVNVILRNYFDKINQKELESACLVMKKN